MNILKRIINMSTHDLQRLQTALMSEIQRRRDLVAETDSAGDDEIIAMPQATMPTPVQTTKTAPRRVA